MDWISWLLSLFGLASDRSGRREDRRSEALRWNAEVAGDAMKTIDILNMAAPRLTRLASQIQSDLPELHRDIIKFLEEQRANAMQILAMTADNKVKLAVTTGRIDWDKTANDFYEWRVTASRMPSWVQGIVDRYDAAFQENGIR